MSAGPVPSSTQPRDSPSASTRDVSTRCHIGLRLHQRGLCRIEIAARYSAFGKELFAVVNDAGVQVEFGLGLRVVCFGLLHVFWNLRLGRAGISRLRGFVGALVILRAADEVGVFKN